MTKIAINSVATNPKYNISLKVLKYIPDSNQIDPIVNSITGYDTEIFWLHLAHFPNCIKNDIIGIFLYNGILFLHKGQNERGAIIDRFSGIL